MTVLKKRFGKLGSHFLFEWTLEVMHDNIVNGLRSYLSPIKPEDIPAMVRKGRFPPLKHLDFSIVTSNAQYLETISEVRLMEFIAEACPDLAKAIEDTGMAGAKYIAKLRLHLLDLVRHPEKAMGKSTDYEAKKAMVQATCDKCGASWPVPKEEASSIVECPFCHE